jgi:cardiolipin synthase (CMP-forming)
VRHIPNIISVIRILLVVPIAMALAHRQLETSILLFALAAASDGADGFLARRFGWQSELGGILDPIADKLLLSSAFVTLSFLKWVPLWLMAAVVARDIIIVGGAASYRFFIGPVAAHPSVVSKCNTLCQAAYILAVVGRAEFAVPHAWVVLWLGALVFATVVVSGIDYVLVYGRRAARAAAAARSGAPTAGARS